MILKNHPQKKAPFPEAWLSLQKQFQYHSAFVLLLSGLSYEPSEF
jgi:hypothetical protein